jgi:hypothetical protein
MKSQDGLVVSRLDSQFKEVKDAWFDGSMVRI